MQARVKNLLAAVRQSRGATAASLAKKAGISRQTIYAIEAGTYVPNTEVSLRIARELEVRVEDIFSLPDRPPIDPLSLTAEVLSAQAVSSGQAVRVCQVGDRMVSAPVSAVPYYLPEADGVIAQMGRGLSKIKVFSQDGDFSKRLALAGCDPATSLLSYEALSGSLLIAAVACWRACVCQGVGRRE